MTLYDQIANSPNGKRRLATARLRLKALGALHRALKASGLSQSELAERLGIRKSAVSQVLGGTGNLRMNTMAEYLFEAGFEVEFQLKPVDHLTRVKADERLATVIQMSSHLPRMARGPRLRPRAGALVLAPGAMTVDKQADHVAPLLATDATDLMNLIEGTDLQYFEVTGRRRDGFDTENEPVVIADEPTITMFATPSESTAMIVRLRLTWEAELMALACDVGARFRWTEPVEYGPGAETDFMQRVGVPYVFPYIRVALDDVAKKMNFGNSGIGILRLDNFKIEPIADGS